MNKDQREVIIEDDYYAHLNVSKEATTEEIAAAYRRLSRLYHPDKHTEDVQKKKADILFMKIKKAYEVLSNPRQRAIYDTVGAKGLNTEGWEIVQRTKTPLEIREEYERLAREKNERRLQQRTNPKGSVIVNINATDIFTSYDDDFYDYGDQSIFPTIEISGMSISQSIDAPLTLRDTLTLSGNLSTHNGNGNGVLSVSCKRLLTSTGSIEAEITAGNGGLVTFKYFRPLTQTLFATFGTQFKFSSNGIKLGFVTNVGMPLDRHTTGYMTWNVGLISSLSTMIVRDTDKSHSTFAFNLNVSNSYVSASHLWQINKADLKLRIYCKFGVINTVVECSAEKKVSEHSSMSAAISIGVPTGVILKIKIVRAHQIYLFPIHLCEEPRLIPSVYAVVTPFVVYFAVKKLVIDPFRKEQKEKEIERTREVNKNKIEEKKREAKAAVDLMEATFEKIRHEEINRNGLVILQAIYGKNADVVSRTPDVSPSQLDQVIDVTVPLQCLVKNSQLTLHSTSKSQLSGFYDPCVGEDKVLFVKYLYHSHSYETVITDADALRIPKQSHRVTET